MICVFDCETIPDTKLIRDQFGLEGNDLEVSNQAILLQEEKSGSGFLPVPFHKVVAICAVIADDFGRFERVNCILGENEKELIENFLNFINKKNPKLISFNGRMFDLPMLMIRAMKYCLSVPSYFEVENKMLNKTKWDNYRYRFSDKFHLDLLDHISDFGAVRGLNLDLLCSMLSLPGKFDVSGDQVVELYYKNELKKINEYCQSDVLNTYLLYLRYELLKGNISKQEYIQNLQIMLSKLPQDKSYSEVFTKSIQKEIDDSNH